MEKLYTVTLSIQYVVVARSEQQAFRIAQKESDEAFRNSGYDDMNIKIEEGLHAEGWDDRAFPYGSTDDQTIGDYKEEMERLAQLKARWESAA